MSTLWLLMLACHWEPDVTGPTGMVGRVLDSGGMPVRGIEVETLEERYVTGEDGHFVVQYKAPDQFAHFRYRGAWYKRLYRAEDEGRSLDLRLPLLRDTALACEVDCELELRWQVDDAFSARATARCEAGRTLPLNGVPRAEPTAVACRGDGPQPVVRDTGARIELLPPPVPVRVEVRGEEGQSPERCAVFVADRPGVPTGEGWWTAEATGVVTITAFCDGRPAVPRTIAVQGAASAEEQGVTLVWSPVGPELDLAGSVPLAGDLWLVAEAGEERGWMLRVPASDDGAYALPPLSAGMYRVALGDPGRLAVMSVPAEAPAPGVLHVTAVTPGDASTPGGLVGYLHLEEDRVEGVIPVSGL